MTLVNRTIVAACLANGEPLSRASDRGVGNTTAAILLAIATAIKNPGEDVTVKDTAPLSAMRAHHTWQAARDVIHKLGLEKVTVKVHRDLTPCIGLHEEQWLVLITSTFAERV